MAKHFKKAPPGGEAEAAIKVIHWFYAYPNREISLNDLSRQLKISKTTANRVVTNLVKGGILKKEVLGKLWRISSNQTPHTIAQKIGYNLTVIYVSGILEEIHKRIPNPRAIILFGSYRRGDDTEKSDIDIAVEVLDHEEPRIFQLCVLPQFGYRKNVPVNVHVFSRNKVNLNLFANMANGIVLEGFLEVRP